MKRSVKTVMFEIFYLAHSFLQKSFNPELSVRVRVSEIEVHEIHAPGAPLTREKAS
jgi:hypothetical protein